MNVIKEAHCAHLIQYLHFITITWSIPAGLLVLEGSIRPVVSVP